MLKTLVKKAMPPIGATEKTALECGSVSLDGLIYKGKFSNADTSTAELTAEEQAFVNVEVPKIINAHVKNGLKDGLVHPRTMKVMADTGIFGLNIPTEYGGKGFAPAANSAIMTALSASGYPSLTVVAMVPNSLGPAELLMHHGTEAERKKYLPTLASGKSIPCFALTGPKNGSDATSNMDSGVLDGNRVIATLNKRYITLAPIADLVGLAIDVEGYGITLFLVERDHPGLEIGMRHDPCGMAFPNGPIRGNIELDLDKHVLGGRDNLGKGWQMLVECLSVGRAISLPAMGTGTAAMCTSALYGYTNARKQFNVPLYKFEALQEKLANIMYHTIINVETQKVINGELNKGEQPAILGAMFKYQATERSRIVCNETMDILGGVAIQRGPNNWIEESYRGIPIGITVEGANALTRSLITFGQGLVRAHPHVRNIVEGAHGSTSQFYKGLTGLIGHSFVNGIRGYVNPVSLFAFTANCTLLLGGKLKRSEYISGRMADFFSNVFFMEILKGISGPAYEYARKRLRYETKEIFYEVVRELPAIIRPKLYAMGAVCFLGASKPTYKDVKSAMIDFELVSSEMADFVPNAGNERLLQLLSDSDYSEEVIQVDDK